MSKDAIGDRMKDFYENRARLSLPRRSYTIVRVDGKAFHTYTRGLKRPFDQGLIKDMNATAAYMCKNMMGAKFAYVQSDEISILLTDFEDTKTQAWFDNNLQKICSVSASMATRAFNEARLDRWMKDKTAPFKWAEFDARVFQVPIKSEVENYFIWRQQDASRNSIQAMAQSLFSPKQLNGKNTSDLQEMCFQKGINWNDYSYREKRGTVVGKIKVEQNGAERSRWEAIETPIFTQERGFLQSLIPSMEV